MAVTVWDIAQKEVDKLSPYLAEDELTPQRLAARNKGTLSLQDAIGLLDALVEAGTLERVERRNPKGGSHIFAYVIP